MFKIILGSAGSGKTIKLKEDILSVGGTLLLLSQIKESTVQEIGNYKSIGVDEVWKKEDFELLESLRCHVNVILATQRTEEEIESFGLGKGLTLHSCSVLL